MYATILIVMSASIILVLGMLHLVYTFTGVKLHPRDRELRARMEAVSPVLTKETTMWKGWVGFNASHSFGAILFGLVYGYLAVAQPALLFGSAFLASVGGLFLLGYLILGKRYWFRIPFGGIVLASICYAAAFAIA